MREIRMSGLTSGDGKRSVAAWPTPPRPSSTLQVKGRKRHALVDTDGRALLLFAHPADMRSARRLSSSCRRRRLVALAMAPPLADDLLQGGQASLDLHRLDGLASDLQHAGNRGALLGRERLI